MLVLRDLQLTSSLTSHATHAMYGCMPVKSDHNFSKQGSQ